MYEKPRGNQRQTTVLTVESIVVSIKRELVKIEEPGKILQSCVRHNSKEANNLKGDDVSQFNGGIYRSTPSMSLSTVESKLNSFLSEGLSQ